MHSNRWWDPVLAAELVCLAAAAPFLYFPKYFPPWGPYVGCTLLLAGALWRKRKLGYWYVRTPADWPLWLWFLMSLPMSVIIASAGLRQLYSYPRALILLWNFSLFWMVVSHCGRSTTARWQLAGLFIVAGASVALAALFGTSWQSKLPLIAPIINRLPSPLLGVFEGAEDGFSPNQVAGTLLFVLPFLLALIVAELRKHRLYLFWPLLLAALIMGIVFIATQSRAGFIGLGVSMAVLVFAPFAWGRRTLAAAACALALASVLLPVPDYLLRLDTATRLSQVSSGANNVASRFDIWQSAIVAIRDFPVTGIGLGTFRKLAPILYPNVPAFGTFDIAHAHNYFFQVALDFGIPGLITILAIYAIAIEQGVSLWRTVPFEQSRYWTIGLMAALIGQTVYSLGDAVSMGAKPNFLNWYLLALVIGLGLPRADRKVQV